MSAQASKSRPAEFFHTHPVFTYEEFRKAHSTGRVRSSNTTHNLLVHHCRAGHLVRVRRGLYATVPPGIAPAAAPVDPYLLATKLTDDATVAYHAALQYHGKAYSVWHRFPFLTRVRARPLRFRGSELIPVLHQPVIRDLPDAGGGVVEERHSGGHVRVTSLERTMVDVLNQPQHGGGWEEIWRSLESVEFFNLDAVISYAVRLQSALTVARVGFFLEQHREALMVENRHLRELRRHAPTQPRYLDPRRQKQKEKFISGWNLVVPRQVLDRSWEEPG